MPRAPLGRLVLALSLGSPSGSFAQVPNQKPAPNGVASEVTGTWRGHSVCAVKGSPCHDEVNVYRVSEIVGRPGWLLVTGIKIVSGQEIVMGTGEWKYDAEKRILESETLGAALRFSAQDTTLVGSFTLRDSTIYRRVYLKKAT
jgi:hypothetical protein